MNADPSNPVAQARKELSARLRQLRTSAGLTGQALADATGQHFTRVSRIENGIQAPTERNIRDWCTACDAADQIPDLVATAQSVESAYLEWARRSRAGMRRLGDLHSLATYQRTAPFRIHEPIVMPGIFQTEAYIRQMLTFWYSFLNGPDDADATVTMKAERTAIALRPAKRIAVVLGEQTLRTRRGTPSEHADQLTHLLSLMRLPFVSIGVIPADAQRHAIGPPRFSGQLINCSIMLRTGRGPFHVRVPVAAEVLRPFRRVDLQKPRQCQDTLSVERETTPRAVSADSLPIGGGQYPRGREQGGREQVCHAAEVAGPGTNRRAPAAGPYVQRPAVGGSGPQIADDPCAGCGGTLGAVDGWGGGHRGMGHPG